MLGKKRGQKRHPNANRRVAASVALALAVTGTSLVTAALSVPATGATPAAPASSSAAQAANSTTALSAANNSAPAQATTSATLVTPKPDTSPPAPKKATVQPAPKVTKAALKPAAAAPCQTNSVSGGFTGTATSAHDMAVTGATGGGDLKCGQTVTMDLTDGAWHASLKGTVDDFGFAQVDGTATDPADSLPSGRSTATYTLSTATYSSSGSFTVTYTPPPPPCVTLSSGNVAKYGSLAWSGTSATVTLQKRDGGYCNDWTFDVTRYSPADFPQTAQQVNAASVGKSGLTATASVSSTTCGQTDGYEGSGPAVGDKLNGPGQGYESNHRFLSQIFGGPDTWTVASSGCNTPPPPPTKVDIPPTPSVTDACGPGNATWDVPANTDSVTYNVRNDGHLIASTNPGFEFTDGTTSHDYGVAPDSNTPCPTPAQPKVDVSAESCVMPGATDGQTLITVTNTADGTHATVEDYVVAVTTPGKTDVTLHTGPVADGASKTLTVLGLQPNTYGVAVTGSDMTGAGTSFVLTACQTPPPPQKTVVSVNIAATGANCGPKAIETYYVGGDLNKVTLLVKVAGKPVRLSSTDSFTVESGQTWSVSATVKDSANTEFPNGQDTESFSGKNSEKPYACPVPPKHQPVPSTTPVLPTTNYPVQSPTGGTGVSWFDNPKELVGLGMLFASFAMGIGLMFTRRRLAHARGSSQF